MLRRGIKNIYRTFRKTTKYIQAGLLMLLVLLNSALFVFYFVLPHMPTAMLGYPISIPGFFTPGREFFTVKTYITNTGEIYLSFTERYTLNVFKSEDDGYTWSNISPPIGDISSLYDLALSEEGDLSLLYHIEDWPKEYLYHIKRDKNGVWSSSALLYEYSEISFAHTFIGNDTLLVSYSRESTKEVDFLISCDFGQTWENYNSYSKSFPIKMISSENQTLFFVTWDIELRKEILLKSVDLGQSWSVQSTSLPSEGRNLLLHPVNGYLYDIFIRESKIKIIYSQDEGKSWNYWIPEELSKDYPVYEGLGVSFDFTPQGECFVVHQLEYLPYTPNLHAVNGFNYFWIDRDIWTDRYTFWFYLFFLLPNIIVFSLLVFMLWLFKKEKYKNIPKSSIFRFYEFLLFLVLMGMLWISITTLCRYRYLLT